MGRTKQNRTEQNRTEENKTGQKGTKQNKTGQKGTKQNKTGENRTKQSKTGENVTEQNKLWNAPHKSENLLYFLWDSIPNFSEIWLLASSITTKHLHDDPHALKVTNW